MLSIFERLFGPPEPKPVYPLEMIKEAKRNPNGYVYVIAPDLDHDGEVPFEAIRGWYRVDAQGEICSDFEPNEKFDPQAYPSMPKP